MLSKKTKDALTEQLLRVRHEVTRAVDSYVSDAGDDANKRVKDELNRRYNEVVKKELGLSSFGELTKDSLLMRALAPRLESLAAPLIEDIVRKPLKAEVLQALQRGVEEGLARGARDIGYKLGQALAERYEKQLQSEIFGVYDAVTAAEEKILGNK
jgi:hypothetical protein